MPQYQIRASHSDPTLDTAVREAAKAHDLSVSAWVMRLIKRELAKEQDCE